MTQVPQHSDAAHLLQKKKRQNFKKGTNYTSKSNAKATAANPQTHSQNDVRKQESVIVFKGSIDILELDHAQL